MLLKSERTAASNVPAAHSVFFRRVFVGLQHPDPVATSKSFDLPHGQVSEFLMKERKNEVCVFIGFFLINKKNNKERKNYLTHFVNTYFFYFIY